MLQWDIHSCGEAAGNETSPGASDSGGAVCGENDTSPCALFILPDQEQGGEDSEERWEEVCTEQHSGRHQQGATKKVSLSENFQ